MGVQDEDVPHVEGVMGGCGWWRIHRHSFDRTEGACGHCTEMNDSQLMHVVGMTSALEAWTALARAYRTRDMVDYG